jgi:hypothetical protein
MLTHDETQVLTHLQQALEGYSELPQPPIGLDMEAESFRQGVEQAQRALYARLGRRVNEDKVQVDYLREEVVKLTEEKKVLDEEKEKAKQQEGT